VKKLFRWAIVLLLASALLGVTAVGVAWLAFGRDLPDVETVPGHTVKLTAPAGEPWQSDGDLIGEFPVTVTVEADAIEVMTPAGS